VQVLKRVAVHRERPAWGVSSPSIACINVAFDANTDKDLTANKDGNDGLREDLTDYQTFETPFGPTIKPRLDRMENNATSHLVGSDHQRVEGPVDCVNNHGVVLSQGGGDHALQSPFMLHNSGISGEASSEARVPVNGSGSYGHQDLTLTNPSSRPACQVAPRSKKSQLYTKADEQYVLSAVEAARNVSTGKVNHRELVAAWNSLRRAGIVSDVERTAPGLLAKHKTLLNEKTLVLGTQEVNQQDPMGPVDQDFPQALTPTIVDLPLVDDQVASTDHSIDRNSDQPAITAHTLTTPTIDPPVEDFGSPIPAEDVNNGTNETEVNAPEYADFQARFERHYTAARLGGSNRRALRPIRGKRIPAELLSLGDATIRRVVSDPQLGDQEVSIGKLNSVVYAVASAIIEYLFERKVTKTPQDWLVENSAHQLLLNQYLGKLKSTMECLRAHSPLTSRQARNLRQLRRVYGNRYKLRSIADMQELYYDLVQHLRKSKHLRKVKQDEKSRQRARWAPLSMLFRKKGEKTNVPIDSVRDYWAEIIGKPKGFVKENPHLVSWKGVCQEILNHGSDNPIPANPLRDGELWKKVCGKARPFKAPGPDGIHNFWWKVLPAANALLFKGILNLRGDCENRPFPRWLIPGRAVSLYKGKGSQDDPGNYRTIACLNTCYKLMTGMINQWIRHDIDQYGFLPYNQLALRTKVWGCTHAHALDRTIVRDALESKRELSFAWIDFAKAFDSLSHEYIRWVLEAIGVKNDLRFIIVDLMTNWRLTFEGFEEGKIRKSSPLSIVNGVLQGDTLSPLIFCLCVAPISHMLNTQYELYVTANGTMGRRHTEDTLALNHQYYVDDLVLYNRTVIILEMMVTDVKDLSKDIGLDLNEDKSAMYHIRSDGAATAKPTCIPTLKKYETYKYLGVDKSETIAHKEMWDRSKAMILSKTRVIWESELTFRQKVTAFNAVCIPKIKYIVSNEIYGVGKFQALLSKGKNLDIAVRRLMAEVKARHKSCSKDRLYLDSYKGGLGIKSFRQAIREAIVYTYCYVAMTPELRPCWSMMAKLDRRDKRTLISDLRQVLTSVNSDLVVERDPTTYSLTVGGVTYREPTKAARAITSNINKAWQAGLFEGINELPIARIPLIDDRGEFDSFRSHYWLVAGLLSSVNVNNIIAAQEGQLIVKGHPMYRKSPDQVCRICRKGGPDGRNKETAEHILTCCAHWRRSLMVKRHNSVTWTLYNAICQKLGFETAHYNQKVQAVREQDNYVLIWDHQIVTTKKLRHNRPDIVIIDHSQKTITIVEVSVSWRTNIHRQEARKFAKYAVNSTLPETYALSKDWTFPNGDNLACELGRDKGYVVTVVPIVMGALGEVSTNIDEYLAKLPLVPSKCRENDPFKDLVERMARNTAIGSAVIIKAHCSIPYKPKVPNTQ